MLKYFKKIENENEPQAKTPTKKVDHKQKIEENISKVTKKLKNNDDPQAQHWQQAPPTKKKKLSKIRREKILNPRRRLMFPENFWQSGLLEDHGWNMGVGGCGADGASSLRKTLTIY